MRANAQQPRSQAGESSKKPPDRGSLASSAAELEGISRAGIGPTFRSGGQAKADSAGHNGTHCGVPISGKPKGNDLSSNKQVGDNFKGYMKCPGAYPESDCSGSGVWGVGG